MFKFYFFPRLAASISVKYDLLITKLLVNLDLLILKNERVSAIKTSE